MKKSFNDFQGCEINRRDEVSGSHFPNDGFGYIIGKIKTSTSSEPKIFIEVVSKAIYCPEDGKALRKEN